MAFPTSPSNGQIYKNYKYNSSLGAWEVVFHIQTKYNITDSNDVTVTLPDANGQTAERTYWRSGAGAGKVLFTTYGSQTINGDSASTWFLEDEGVIKLAPVSGNWEVVEFEDNVGWSNVTFETNMENIGGTWDISQYKVRRNLLGTHIKMKGLLRKTSGNFVDNDSLFTIPTKYCPSAARAWPVIAHEGSGIGNETHRVDWNPTNQKFVLARIASPSTVYVDIDTIDYML